MEGVHSRRCGTRLGTRLRTIRAGTRIEPTLTAHCQAGPPLLRCMELESNDGATAFRGCRSEARADRALPDAWCSSGAGVWGAWDETIAFNRRSGRVVGSRLRLLARGTREPRER